MAAAFAAAGLSAIGLALATPWDLLPAVAAMLVAWVLAPRAFIRAGATTPVLRPIVWMACGVAALVALSVLVHDGAWRELDNRARLLLMPAAALAVVALRPSRAALWWGALAGLAIAAATALVEALGGVERADGWAHPIVFANVVAGLLAIVLFCRPAGGLRLATIGAAFGLLAIGLSGSRGAWAGVAVVVVASLASHAGHMRRVSVVVGGTLLLGLLAAWSMPPLAERTRLQELRQDIDRYALGDAESSLGARLTLYRIAARTIADAPLAGVGVGAFGRAVRAQPECIAQPERMACTLGHAHNDALEWGATMGVPGLLAWASIFAVPLLAFARLLRGVAPAARARSAAAAGIAVVLAFAACGLTQSLFAHQLSATFYALAVGALLGFAIREAEPAG